METRALLVAKLTKVSKTFQFVMDSSLTDWLDVQVKEMTAEERKESKAATARAAAAQVRADIVDRKGILVGLRARGVLRELVLHRGELARLIQDTPDRLDHTSLVSAGLMCTADAVATELGVKRVRKERKLGMPTCQGCPVTDEDRVVRNEVVRFVLDCVEVWDGKRSRLPAYAMSFRMMVHMVESGVMDVPGLLESIP